MKDKQIGIIILAAGASLRLGKPKQLLQFEGKTLLRRAVETAIETDFQTVVVLGANFEKTKAEIEDLEIEICFNENWQNGMSSSLKTGLKIAPNLSAVIIALCDQPFVNSTNLKRLAEIFQTTNAPIVACEYAGTIGVPALFASSMFDELLNLSADEGAKKIIKNHLAEVEKISVPEAEIDIDTVEDYKKII